MLNRLVKNNMNGVTLVELLATIILVSIVATLAYSVLFQGYNNYQRVKVETELRDEADLIMASFIKDIFVLKESQITIADSCPDMSNIFHLNIIKKDPITGSTIPSYKTGFENNKVIVNGQQVQFYNQNVELLAPTCSTSSPTGISKTEDGTGYNIKFTLRTKNSKKELKMEFFNTIQVIDDQEEEIVKP